MNGKIIIGTELDTKDFEKQLKEQKKLLEQYNKEAEELVETRASFEYNKEKAQKNLDKVNADLEKAKIRLENLQATGFKNLIPEQTDKIKNLENDANDLKFIIENSNQGLAKTNEKIRQNVKSQQLMRDAIEETNQKIQMSNNLMNTQKTVDKIGNSIKKIIKSVGKWALAVFGVRSAYMFVRQAMSTLAQYDKQLATDIEFIRYAVATTLEPVIKFIVQLAYKLLTAINLIWERIFGASLFSKNLATNFKNAKNQANGLKKTLAGFDEMNVLGSGGMGINLSPSFDPSKADKGMETWINKAIEKIKGFAGIITKELNKIFPNLNFGLIGTTLVNDIQGAFNIIKGIITNNIPTLNQGIGTLVNNLGNKIKTLPTFFELGVNSIIGSGGPFVKLGEYLGKTFAPKIGDIFKQMWAGIKQGGIDMWNGLKSAGKGFAKAIIDVINFLIDAVNGFISPFRAIIVGAGNIVGKKWTMKDVKIPHVKGLAKGGIVNLPGKGVPVGGAIAGESGREAVLPLQDSQVLQEIADAIGRRITINANIVNSMNGRVLSREIQKIQNQSNFAMNR